MLLSITERCRMGCSHCMDDAKPEGNDMDYKTFKDAIEFNFKYDNVLIVTGGEPTEHPMFWKFMFYIVKNYNNSEHVIIITTNGMNIDNDPSGIIYERMVKLNKIFKGLLYWQVSIVPEYYKIKINEDCNTFKVDNVQIDRELAGIYPQGRAVKNNIPIKNTKASKCFNLRSLIRNNKYSFSNAITALRVTGKFCTPQISYDGKIKLGESLLCPPVSSIYDDIEDITNSIYNFKCSGCNILNDKLPYKYLKAIGEV